MEKIVLCIALVVFSQTVFSQTKIDEYGKIITDDESARLYNFVEQLKKDKTVSGTLVIYKDKSETTGKFLRHFYGVKSILMNSFGVSPDSFSIVFGGEDIRRTEIWLNNSKEESSKFESKILDETLAGKINRKTLFDNNCIDCDESPFINQFIFGAGLDYLAEALKANPDTSALIQIAKVEYLAESTKERKDLINLIFDRLKKSQIPKDRISVKFIRGVEAKFYIIPKANKNKILKKSL